MNSSELSLFALFLALNLIGSVVNHIDDTDETYGYWEPLHYLVYGVGMQTWEYSPQYAIRTYSFIYPFYLLSKALEWRGLSKNVIFYVLKGTMGTIAAYAQTRFTFSLYRTVGQSISSNAAVFLLLAPGVFFASTAYLPSAVCMSLLMLSIASWLENRFLNSIIWGSIAVLCTGWPFVGLLFLPLGLHMVAHSYASVIASKGTHASAALKVVHLAVSGLVMIAVIQGTVFLLDYRYYNRWYACAAISLHSDCRTSLCHCGELTLDCSSSFLLLLRTSPTLNILLYNAIGGSGDELYGIEPASYYIKNLFLNMGVAWPLVLLSPAVYLVSFLVNPRAGSATQDGRIRGLVLHVQALLWLGVLFSRPHKVESLCLLSMSRGN
jgi:alpha-1,2-mannosyltransferase